MACLLGISAAPVLAQCPVAGSCTPGAASDPDAAIFGGGIQLVTLGTLTSTSVSTDGYQDYSCLRQVSLTVGTNYALTVRVGTTAENVRVWIDYDNNGILNAATEQFYAGSGTGLLTGSNLRVPTTAVLNTPLRMRVSSDFSTSPTPTPCSTPEYGQVEDYAVRVVSGTVAPQADFRAEGSPTTCTGVVQFTDLSLGAPSTWRWRFGDGTASLQQNPVHTYTTPGTYSVTLTVTNGQGSDSLTRSAYITYNNQVPVAACAVPTAAYCCGFGIGRVQFGTIDRTSGDGVAGYEDRTCTDRTQLVAGTPVRLTVTGSGTNNYDIRAWIDYNNDGQFQTTEQVLTTLNAASGTALVTPPATVVAGTPLRLRVIADAAGSPSGPCVSPRLGQAEDYTITVAANTLAPVARFGVATRTPCDSVVQFRDSSLYAPTAWRWRFGDGAVSTLPNPTHEYTQAGTYTVTLRVTNSFGTDSLVKTNYISFTRPCLNYCIPMGLQTQSVWISRVRLTNLDNASALDAYADYTAFTSTVQQGQVIDSLTVNAVSQMSRQTDFAAWIDFNQSGTWEATELVAQGTIQGQPGARNVVFQRRITIPTTARLGATRMRVVATRNQGLAGNACVPDGAPGVEVEDYTVLIVSPTPAAPVAAFSATPTVSCDGLVQFSDESANTPTAWTWTFGDNTSSTQQNPLHQYPATAATYAVKLAIRNAIGRDSVVRTAYIQVTNRPVPRAAACQPASITPGFGIGINRVTLGTLRSITGTQTDGYRDYTCTQQVTLNQGTPYTLTVTNIQNGGANVNAWIDYNNDGVFQTTERVMNSLGGANHTATITVPTTALLRTPLRLRIGSDWTMGPEPEPCTAVQYGQFEDYTVLVAPMVATPAERTPLALTLAPNPAPAGSPVLIRLMGTDRPVSELPVTVRTVLGQEVRRARLRLTATSTEVPLDLGDLPAGVYVLTFDGPTAALRGTTRLVLTQ